MLLNTPRTALSPWPILCLWLTMVLGALMYRLVLLRVGAR